ncbi:hypothetical protein [Glycomyces sp. NPDC048151]|uniref:hypothetical protein n=1 Tax=Glycomyces sp. NPDC048151 TaxID=3364002 RepID=UPI0037106D13
MLTSFLPGLRQLRAPLAAGTIWLVALWIAWGRRHPGYGLPADFTADVDRLAGSLGAGAVLGALVFAAYCIGIVWTNLQYNVIAIGGVLLRRHTPQLAHRLATSRIIPNWRRRTLRSFTTADGYHAQLLGKLGMQRPDHTPSDPDTRRAVLRALEQDLEWVNTVVPDQAPALADQYARAQVESRFAAALAIPLPVCAVTFMVAVMPGWSGVLWGAVISAVGAYGLWWAAQSMRVHAVRIMLEAFHIGILHAPALTTLGLELWGPVEDPQQTVGDGNALPDTHQAVSEGIQQLRQRRNEGTGSSSRAAT